MKLFSKIVFFLFFPFFAFAQFEDYYQEETGQTSAPAGIVRFRTNKDSIRPDITLFSWRYIAGWMRENVPSDTTQLKVVMNDPMKIGGFYNIGLGNLGQPVMFTDFNQRSKLHDIHWAFEFYRPYLKTHRDMQHFDTKKAYSRLYYTNGSQRLQTFHFIHTQNVSKAVNFGLDCNFFSSEGLMVQQRGRNRNGMFWFGVDHSRYRNRMSISFNSLNTMHNGGITDLNIVTERGNSLREIEVKLIDSRNSMGYIDSGLEHEFSIIKPKEEGLKFSTGIGHELHFLRIKRLYTDPLSTLYNDPITGEMTDFFDNRYKNLKTEDTLSKNELNNAAGLFFKAGNQNFVKLSVYGKLRDEKYNNIYRDTLFNYLNDTSLRTFYQILRLEGNVGILQYVGEYEFNPNIGYRSGESKLFCDIRFGYNILIDSAVFVFNFLKFNKAPDYQLNRYFSNHYKWKNHWQSQDATDISLRVNLVKSHFSFITQFNTVNNYIYLDSKRNWTLYPNRVEVFGAGVEKTLNLGRFFSIRAKTLYQFTNDDEVIDIPDLASSATFLLKVPLYFKATEGKTTLQIGIDGFINTKYYVPDFDPALNRFYMQRKQQIGNYPFFDAFLSLHIQRIVTFIRVEHFNSGIIGTSYFDAYSYPTRTLFLKFGFSWTFYD